MRTEKEIGDIVKQLRGEQSLRDFAKLCDTSHTTIDTIEKGYDFRTKKPAQVKLITLQKIALATNVPLSYIIGDERVLSPGVIIQQIRDEKGLSLEQLSLAVGVSVQMLKDWESGNTQFLRGDKIIALTQALDLKIEDFIVLFEGITPKMPRSRILAFMKISEKETEAQYCERYSIDHNYLEDIKNGITVVDYALATKLAVDNNVDIEFVYGYPFRTTVQWEENDKEIYDDMVSYGVHKDILDLFEFRHRRGQFTEKTTPPIGKARMTVTDRERDFVLRYRKHQKRFSEIGMELFELLDELTADELTILRAETKKLIESKQAKT